MEGNLSLWEIDCTLSLLKTFNRQIEILCPHSHKSNFTVSDKGAVPICAHGEFFIQKENGFFEPWWKKQALLPVVARWLVVTRKDNAIHTHDNIVADGT